jgi:exonuclease III
MLKNCFIFFLLLFSSLSLSATHCNYKLLKRFVRSIENIPIDTPMAMKDIKSLRLMSFNVDMMSSHMGKFRYDKAGNEILSTDFGPVKPKEKISMLARVINKHEPDIMMFQEIADSYALKNLSDIYLGGKYEAIFIKGNDSKRHVGFLYNKKLPFELQLETFAHRESEYLGRRNWKVFDRDVPALILSPKGKKDQPLAIILGTHYRAMRTSSVSDFAKKDPGNKILRQMQYEETAEIVRMYQDVYGKHVPIIIGGDFNTYMNGAGNLRHFKEAGMSDAFDLTPQISPVNERFTHVTIDKQKNKMLYSQLDGFMVSNIIKSNRMVRGAGVQKFYNKKGQILKVPQSIKQREQLMFADHFPVWLNLDFQKILDNFYYNQDSNLGNAAGF